MRNRIVVAGGSGFIGRLLTDRLVSGNNDVIVLTRSPGPAAQSIRQVGWDGRTLADWARRRVAAPPERKDGSSTRGERAWAEAFLEGSTPATRKVALRTAMVFAASKGGVYRVLRGLTRWGLGGAIAGGRQYISWIHEADFGRAVEWLIDQDDFSGPVNLASPNQIPQREMMRIIRRELGVPFGLPATRRMLEVAAFIHRTEAELILKIRRVVPGRLLAAGFQFRFPRMEDAVREIEGRLRLG